MRGKGRSYCPVANEQTGFIKMVRATRQDWKKNCGHNCGRGWNSLALNTNLGVKDGLY